MPDFSEGKNVKMKKRVLKRLAKMTIRGHLLRQKIVEEKP